MLLGGPRSRTRTEVVILREERRLHLCWSLPGAGGEVMLLGGSRSPTRTEVVSADGSSSRAGWNLAYRTE